MTIEIDVINPWEASNWISRVIDLDHELPNHEVPWSTDFKLAKVEASAESGGGWDGTVAALVRLSDNRWMAWETFWGPTGDGFSEDAYGGDADVFMSVDRAKVIKFGLTDEGRRMLELADTQEATT